MPQHPVLCHRRGGQGLRISVKQTVVSHAESHHYIQVCLCLIQQLCLEDGITGSLSHGVALFINAKLHLGHSAGLAADAVHLKAVLPENGGQGAALRQKAHAGGDAQFFGPYLPGEIHDLLHAGVLAVVLTLHIGGGHGDFMNFLLAVAVQRLPERLRVHVGGHAEIRICVVPLQTAFCSTVNAGQLFVHHISPLLHDPSFFYNNIHVFVYLYSPSIAHPGHIRERLRLQFFTICYIIFT